MNLPGAATEAMRRTNALFCEAVRQRDFGALRRVYAADAKILPPGAEMVEGVAAIEEFWTNAVTGLEVKDVSLTTITAEAAGEGAVEIGRAELTLASGVTVPVKYVVHWKQVNGSWRWQTDIWNMNV